MGGQQWRPAGAESAHNLSVPLAGPCARNTAALPFTGVQDSKSFNAEVATVGNALGGAIETHPPWRVADGAELILRGAAADTALVITRSMADFATGDSAHLVQCRSIADH